MQTVALIIVIASGVWLIGIAVLMAARPDHGLQLFENMISNLGESIGDCRSPSRVSGSSSDWR